jgi:hypothetical protein
MISNIDIKILTFDSYAQVFLETDICFPLGEKYMYINSTINVIMTCNDVTCKDCGAIFLQLSSCPAVPFGVFIGYNYELPQKAVERVRNFSILYDFFIFFY